MLFRVGVLSATMMTAPTSIGHQDRQAFIARQATVSELWHGRWLSFDAEHSITFSVLQPTGIAMQAVLGDTPTNRRSDNADVTGSILESSAGDGAGERSAGSPAANRQLKGDRLVIGGFAPAESTQVAEIPSASDATSSQDVNRTVISKQTAITPPPEDAHRATIKTQLALAVARPVEDSNRSVIKRRPDASAAPPIMIGHSYDDHNGGDIEVFAAKYEKIQKSGRKVVIDGLCFSACTIVASLPKDQVCVTPKASLGVHLATNYDGPDEHVDIKYTNWAVKKYYPRALQDWIKKHGGLEEEPKYVKGNDLLTIFDACKKGA